MRDFDPSIYEDPKKLYINFLRNKTIIFSLVPLQDALLITLNAKPQQFIVTEKLEDISNKVHWGVGNYRMKIESEDDIWTALDYIQHVAKGIKQ